MFCDVPVAVFGVFDGTEEVVALAVVWLRYLEKVTRLASCTYDLIHVGWEQKLTPTAWLYTTYALCQMGDVREIQ